MADVHIKALIGAWLKEKPNPQNGFIISGDAGFGESFKLLKSEGHSTFGVVAKGKEEDMPTKITNEVKRYWVWRPFIGMSAQADDGTSSKEKN